MEYTATKNSKTVFRLETWIRISFYSTIPDYVNQLGQAFLILQQVNKFSPARHKLPTFNIRTSLLPSSQKCLNGH